MSNLRFALGTILGLTAGGAGVQSDALSDVKAWFDPNANTPCTVYREMADVVRGRVDRDAVVMIKQSDGTVCTIRHRAAEVEIKVKATPAASAS